MSMLAERKSKQKWSLNPRGKDWSQDVNKFGQKMLEKMGWQQGKGLGANEDGIIEHIKVSYKNDSKGMGYKESSDQWTEHETNFSALLKSLSGTVENLDEIKPKSLEEKSQVSRARVHYHKFTRGKDLSRYSEKDLANIFGKKSLKEPKKEEVKLEPVTSHIEKLENDSRFHIHAGSMKDYFKRKLPNFGKGNGYVVGSNGVLKKEESDSESDFRPSFNFNKHDSDLEESNQYAGFGFKSEDTEFEQKPSFISYITEENCSESDKKKKKKKKRKMEEGNEDSLPKKKSKTEGLSNPAFNPLYTPIKVEKHVLTPIEESISEEKSVDEENLKNTLEVEAEVYEEVSKTDRMEGRLKKKKRVEVIEENFREASNTSVKEEFTSITGLFEGRKKKKKKNMEVIEENAIEVCNWSLKEEYTSITNGENQVIEKRITKKKKSVLTIDNPNLEETSQDSVDRLQTEENSHEVEVKDKKKKKKEKFAIENPIFNESVEESTDFSRIEENPYEVKIPVKKKKKKMKLALENPNFDGSTEVSADISLSEDNPHEVKRKKSKKLAKYSSSLEEIAQIEEQKKKKEETALENLGFDISIEESSSSSQPEENPYEVKNKKKKKKKSTLAWENPGFDISTDNSVEVSQNEDNPYEVKTKKKKEENMALENPAFSLQDLPQRVESGTNGDFEVKRKKKKKKKVEEENGIANPALNLDTSSEIKENISLNVEESDLMLNIVTTPVVTTPKTTNGGDYNITKVTTVKRRKSVRFSDVTEERIIPNNDELRNLSDIEGRDELFDINAQVLDSRVEDQNESPDFDNTKSKKRKLGLDNAAFDKQKTSLEENVDTISKTLERYQAEIENDINEKKLEAFGMDDVMVGEVGNPHGENEKLPDGTKLKFKYAHFVGRTPGYHLDKLGAKKSYRHLIKGDIVLKFKNTNLHQIDGYAVKGRSAVV